MSDLGGLLSTALGVVSIATLAALGLLRGTVTNLRENLTDARNEITDKERRLTECEAKAQRLTADLDALGRVVTGETHWVALGEQLHQHNVEAESYWAQARQNWRDASGLLVEIRDLLRDKP